MSEMPENEWRLYDAKNKLSEVVNRAIDIGPQSIRRSQDEVVLISRQDFERLSGKKKTFIEFLRSGPSFDGLDFERDRSSGRELTL